MRVYMVNEGTLRKPQGPCYAFAVFLQLKEVHLFPVKSHCVTANWEYFKSIMNKHKISPVSESAPVTFGQRFPERNSKHQASLCAWNITGWGSSPCTLISFSMTSKTDMEELVCVENHLILSSHIWQYCLSSAPSFKIKGLNHDSNWAVYNN